MTARGLDWRRRWLVSALAAASVVLLACDGSPHGSYRGKTHIGLFRSSADEHGYMEVRDDEIVIDDAGDDLKIDWLGCSFRAEDEGSDASELKPTECKVELEDGRSADLTIGKPPSTFGIGTTVATMYPEGDSGLEIHIVARLKVEGAFYSPTYFRFMEGE